jgi:hypothetical protein
MRYAIPMTLLVCLACVTISSRLEAMCGDTATDPGPIVVQPPATQAEIDAGCAAARRRPTPPPAAPSPLPSRVDVIAALVEPGAASQHYP